MGGSLTGDHNDRQLPLVSWGRVWAARMLVQLGNTDFAHPEPSAEVVTTFCWEPEMLKAGLKQPESHAKAPEGMGTAGRPGDTQLRGPLAQSQAVVLTTAEKSGQNIPEGWPVQIHISANLLFLSAGFEVAE